MILDTSIMGKIRCNNCEESDWVMFPPTKKSINVKPECRKCGNIYPIEVKICAGDTKEDINKKVLDEVAKEHRKKSQT